MKTWQLFALVGGVAAVGVAMGGGDDDEPDRMKDRIDPPQDDDAQRMPHEPVTIQMMREPQPMPNVAEPSPAWSRALLRNEKAWRTDDEAAPIVRHKLLPGTWVVARMWLSSDYAPARENDDEFAPAAAFWSWSGPLQVGTTIPVVLKAVEFEGQDRPRMTWISAQLRINIFGELELRIVYPGETSTGENRGRKYDVVLEWRALPSPPT